MIPTSYYYTAEELEAAGYDERVTTSNPAQCAYAIQSRSTRASSFCAGERDHHKKHHYPVVLRNYRKVQDPSAVRVGDLLEDCIGRLHKVARILQDCWVMENVGVLHFSSFQQGTRHLLRKNPIKSPGKTFTGASCKLKVSGEILEDFKSINYETPEVKLAQPTFSVGIDMGGRDTTGLALILNDTEVVAYATLDDPKSVHRMGAAIRAFTKHLPALATKLRFVADMLADAAVPETPTQPTEDSFTTKDIREAVTELKKQNAEVDQARAELSAACCRIGAMRRVGGLPCPLHTKPEPFVPSYDTFDFLKP